MAKGEVNERLTHLERHCTVAGGSGRYDPEAITKALVAAIESGFQAPDDFCGEQREWHLPRIQAVMLFLMDAFPEQAVDAMKVAKTPYGDLIAKGDN